MRRVKLSAFLIVLFFVLSITFPAPSGVQAQAVRPQPPFVSESVYQAMKSGSASVIVVLNTSTGTNLTQVQNNVAAAQASVLSTLPVNSYSVRAQYAAVAALSMEITPESLAALENNPAVKAINLNETVTLHDTEAKQLANVPQVHNTGFTGSGTRVAVIDSGINLTHSALADDIFAHVCARLENDCPNQGSDENGHGTHVAGIITGAGGVAPNAEIIAIKVFRQRNTTNENVLNALDLVIQNDTTWNTTAVNMSLGGGLYATQIECDNDNAAYKTAFEQLNALGIPVFVSTGNDASTAGIGAPGCVTGAIGVGSVGDAVFNISFGVCEDAGSPDKVTCFSNATATQGAGELVDILAPGCNITAEWVGNSTATNTICGTSMASPFAAGIGALLLEASPGLLPSEIEDILETSGTPVVDYRNGVTYPRVDAYNALSFANITLDTPTGFVAIAIPGIEISLIWNDVSGETGYELQSSRNGVNWSTLLNLGANTTSYSHKFPPCGTVYYRLRAINTTNYQFSQFTPTVNSTVRPCPSAPTNLTGQVLSPTSTQLSWVDNASNEETYILERSLEGGPWIGINLPANTTTYTDTTLSCGINRYRVKAVRNTGLDISEPSNIVTLNVCAPENDLFANAQVITGTITDEEPNIRYATISPDDPALSCRFSGATAGSNSVWYALSPNENTRFQIDTIGSNLIPPSGDPNFNDTIIGVYTGTQGNLTEVACSEDIAANNFLSQVTVDMQAGMTYYVYVTRWSTTPMSWDGTLRVNFKLSEPPSTLTATRITDGVQLSWTPLQQSTEYRLERRIAVTGTFAEIATIPNPTVTYTNNITPCAIYDYRIRGYNPSTSTYGDYSNIVRAEPANCSVAPTNDEWVNADIVASFPYTDTTPNLIYATTNPSDPAAASMPGCTLGFPRRGTNSIWYSITPTLNGTLTVDSIGSQNSTGSALDTFIVVYSGTYGAFTQLACNDESGGSTSRIENLPVTAGTTYYVYLARYSNAAVASAQSYVFNANFVPDPLPGSFTQIAPQTGGMYMLATAPTTFTWNAATDADSYTLTINNGTNDIISVTGVNGTSYTLSAAERALIVAGNYTWTVSAVNANGSTTASNAPFSFTVYETPTVIVTPTNLTVSEGGTGQTYSVVLSAMPAGPVLITVAGDSQAQPDTNALTFDATNWNVPQFVLVNATDDPMIEGIHSGTITHTAAGDIYDGVAVSSVNVTIIDNDNLLQNASFELGGTTAKDAIGWTGLYLSKKNDRRVCNNPLNPSVAAEGNCAFRFKFNGTLITNTSFSRSLVQVIDAPGLNAGDTVSLQALVRANNLVLNGMIRVRAFYADGTRQTMNQPIVAGTYDYTLLTKSMVLTGTPTRIVVIIQPRKTTGVFFVDGLVLQGIPAAPLAPVTTDPAQPEIPLPLPPAPEVTASPDVLESPDPVEAVDVIETPEADESTQPTEPENQ